mgnify:CR=1 FL=1
MKTIFRKLLGVGIAAGLVTGFTAVTGKTALAWEPVKPIQFVVMAGKGGGADKLARLIQSIIEKHKLSSKPVTPIKNATTPAMTPMWNDAKPVVKPFCALYITVIRPISVPVSVAMPSHGPTARPAPTKFVMLPANRLTQKATATESSR